MLAVVNDYFRELTDRFGAAWNRFWFLPSDPLTLSVLRVLVGLIAFYTVLTYTPDLEIFLSEDGLLPLDAVAQLRSEYVSFSYLNWLRTPGQLWAGHLVGLGILALFTAGLFTRVTSVLSLVVILSYFHRSFLVTAELEPVLAFLLLYLALAPCGAYLSLDGWRANRGVADTSRATVAPAWSGTVATRLIQIHLSLVYLMMLLAQLNENTWWDGTAMWWLIGRRESTLTDLTWLHAHRWLVNIWTHGFIAFEAAFLLLAWNRLAVPLLIAASIVAWGLMAVVTGLIPFALLMIVAGLAFVRPESMRTLLGCCGLDRLLK